jgi:Do/DeqQ family serine protease
MNSLPFYIILWENGADMIDGGKARMRNGRKRLTFVVIYALIGALVFSFAIEASGEEKSTLGSVLSDLLGSSDNDKKPADSGAAQKDQTLRRVPFGREEIELSFAPLVKRTAPAVVNVYASSKVRVQSPFMDDPFFGRFFGQQMPPRVQSSLGSGVIVDPSGIIVTNNHVIKGADEVKVALPDGREFESKIVLKDDKVDQAVLKIKAPDPLPTIPLGDSDALEVGDLVLAMGNPFGVGQTTTSGIISALARTHIGVSDYSFFIQTDAAINPGNSGGALINMAGQLVGINTAIYSRSGGSIGIGFAIPSNMVRAFLQSAKSGADYFERPYIGAEFQEVTPQFADALGMDKPTGALVSSVAKDGPAAEAGLKAGDVVVAMDGVKIDDPQALNFRLSTQPIGSTSTFDIVRQGEKKQVKVKLERAPAGESSKEITIDGQSPFAGAKVAALSPRLAQRLGMPTDSTGVVIVDLEDDSAAASLGFAKGDIIREVNGAEIKSAEDLEKAASRRTRLWRFTFVRDGQTIRQILQF